MISKPELAALIETWRTIAADREGDSHYRGGVKYCADALSAALADAAASRAPSRLKIDSAVMRNARLLCAYLKGEHADVLRRLLDDLDDALAAGACAVPQEDFDTPEDPQKTLDLIAVMLGWGNTPPRRVFEQEIKILRERAACAVPETQEEPPDEIAWVIEDALARMGQPCYWTGIGRQTFSTNHLKAIRFARKQDAECVAALLTIPAHIVEHMWSAPCLPMRDDRDATCAWDCTLPFPHEGPCAASRVPAVPVQDTPAEHKDSWYYKQSIERPAVQDALTTPKDGQ